MLARRFSAVMLLLPVFVVVLPEQSPQKHRTQTAVAAQGVAQGLLQAMPSPFVANLGQWPHQGKYIHRAGPIYLASNAVPVK